MLVTHAATPVRVVRSFFSLSHDLLLPPTTALVLAVFAPSQWLPTMPSTSPPARTDAAMAFDPTIGAVLVVGGDDTFGNPLGDTWLFDGSDWIALPGSLPARTGARMVFDAARSTMVLYGGASNAPFGGAAIDETWEGSGGLWAVAAPAVTPGGRAWHGLAFDVARSRTVLYGGRVSDFVFASSADTWEYDGATWQQRVTSQSPGPRSKHAMCYHAGLGVTVLFGGEAAPFSSVDDQTWHFDGSNWLQVALAGARPPARIEANFVYDAARAVCVLHGGQDVGTGAYLADTWEWDGAVWTNVTPAVAQPTLYRAAMAMDTARGRIVAFGGFDGFLQPLAATWQYGADATRFGVGCAGGNGVPSLAVQSPPRLGSVFTVHVNQASSVPVGAMVLGLSNTFAGTAPLPIDLTTFGFTGCLALVRADAWTSFPVVGGVGIWAAPLPLASNLLGFQFHQQAVVLDLAANPGGAVTSDALTVTLGR